jgi:tetratricopeptide (TPR) repeat protein
MSMIDEQARAGLKAIEEKRYDDAITAFRSVVEMEPHRPDINHALGMAYLHRGDAGNALPHLEAAVRLAEPYDLPQHQQLKRDFHLSLATTYQLLDRAEDARTTLETVVRRWPETVEARLQLGQLLMSTCRPLEGCKAYEDSMDWLDKEQRQSAEALVGTVKAFLETEHPASVFLEAHGDSYRQYFDTIAAEQIQQGWYAEAARMHRGPDGELRPALPAGARPYALTRVDLVNPADGSVAGVYSESEPMIVAVQGLEPLAQVPILLPWAGFPFEVWVSTRCPWHWVSIVLQLREPLPEAARVDKVDEAMGSWYLAGWNGEFGEGDQGRFHYITDPDPVGSSAVAYMVDLGRAKMEAIHDLLRRLTVLHERVPLRRILFGEGRLPE